MQFYSKAKKDKSTLKLKKKFKIQEKQNQGEHEIEFLKKNFKEKKYGKKRKNSNFRVKRNNSVSTCYKSNRTSKLEGSVARKGKKLDKSKMKKYSILSKKSKKWINASTKENRYKRKKSGSRYILKMNPIMTPMIGTSEGIFGSKISKKNFGFFTPNLATGNYNSQTPRYFRMGNRKSGRVLRF